MNPDYKKAIEEAKKLLKENYFTCPPIDVLVIARNEGLSIMETSLNEIGNKEIAGFIDVEEKIIYVNAEDSENRKVFTIAHELGHWILHRDKLLSNPLEYAVLYRKPIGQTNNDPIEKEANCFAGNLLVPTDMLLKYKEIDNLTLSKIFGVSTDVIGFRKKILNGF